MDIYYDRKRKSARKFAFVPFVADTYFSLVEERVRERM
jgi:hypothetical protein